MVKRIRFIELVKCSGKPETLTLWTKPAANPVLVKAVRENRVLTIPRSKAAKKDVGRIGFHQEPSATYLIFPKKLPKAGEVGDVIGIHYELLAVAEEVSKTTEAKTKPGKTNKTKPGHPSSKAAAAASPSKAKPELPAKPAKKHFDVSLLRIMTNHIKLSVVADSIEAAEAESLKRAKCMKLPTGEVQLEVEFISLRKPI